VTPAQVYRAALCLADALDVVKDEMRREDACQEIITAHAGAAASLCDGLEMWSAGGDDREHPDGARAVEIAGALMSDAGPSAADLTRWADAWRTWGESLRASLAACPVCEEAKAEAPGPMCEDLHASPFGPGCKCGIGESFPPTRLHNPACPVHGGAHG
jgi:hypothetical protein